MAIEHAAALAVDKPWGSFDLRPWSEIRHDGAAIGELWFQRNQKNAPLSSLLLKLLFTTQPLSIQVHPGDAFAQSVGMANGKTEAWYVLSATPGARVAVGLKRRLTSSQLRTSIDDGSIAELVQWRVVRQGDIVDVPAGTIHSIGAGLVVAEIQQRGDATFRLFDYGRKRELHADSAVAVANAGPAARQSGPKRLTDSRTLLVSNPYFVFERIDLASTSNWDLQAEIETWLLVLEGGAKIGPAGATVGEAIFLEGECASIKVGRSGLKALLAYPGPKPIADLLREAESPSARRETELSLHRSAKTAWPASSAEVRV